MFSVQFERLDFVHNIENCTIPCFQYCNNSFIPLQIIRFSDQGICLFLQTLDGNVRHTGFIQALDEILAELDGITDGSITVDDPEQRTADIYDEILQIMNKEYTEYVLGDIAHYRYVNDEELAEKNKQDTLAIQDMSDMAYVSLQKALLGPYGGTLSEAFSDEQLDELEEYEALTDRERELIDQETELQQEYDRLSEEEYSFEYEGKTWTMDDLYTDTPEDQEDIAEKDAFEHGPEG